MNSGFFTISQKCVGYTLTTLKGEIKWQYNSTRHSSEFLRSRKKVHTLSSWSILLLTTPIAVTILPLHFHHQSPWSPSGFYLPSCHKPTPHILSCCYCSTLLIGSDFYFSYILLYNYSQNMLTQFYLLMTLWVRNSDRAQWVWLVSEPCDVDMWEK